MRLGRKELGRWAVPVALAATLVAGLLISPVIAGTNGITKKKVVKTIRKKTRATYVQFGSRTPGITGNPDSSSALMASVDLPQGNYVVSSTFNLIRDSGAVVTCRLRIDGIGEDKDVSGGGSALVSSVALSTAGALGTGGGKAELRCNNDAPATSSAINDVEIVALKVPFLGEITQGGVGVSP
jgi:hypothetical protein